MNSFKLYSCDTETSAYSAESLKAYLHYLDACAVRDRISDEMRAARTAAEMHYHGSRLIVASLQVGILEGNL